MKSKPLYWKSTHFAASVQYLNFISECIIFPLALVLYINHYKMDRNLYDNWEYYPITDIQKIQDTECPYGTEIIFTYDYPEIGGGCDCGIESSDDENGQPDISKLHTEHCLASEIDEGCIDVETIVSTELQKWNGELICGKRSQFTYRQLFYEQNCTSICRGVCVKNKNDTTCGNYNGVISQENTTQSYYNFTLGYGESVCYENGDYISTTYPLLESAYSCLINSSEFAYIDQEDSYQLFEENGYQYETLPGIKYYQSPPVFGLFGEKFSEYNCTIKQIDVANFRDNYIQIVLVVCMQGCLMGFGAIFHSAIIQNLTRKGIFKHKIYKVTWKFYCPTTFLILLHMAHFAIVCTKLGFLQHFRSMMNTFVVNKCTDMSNILNLIFMKDFIDSELMPLCIPELVLTFGAMLLEILQLCLFDRRIPERIESPTLKGRDSPAKTNNFILNFGIASDENVEKHVLDTDNIRISNKNEQLKLYNE